MAIMVMPSGASRAPPADSSLVAAGNLASVAGLTWCAVRYVNETGGRIINVTSRGAYRGETRHPAYGRARSPAPEAEWASGAVLGLNGASWLR